MAAPTTAARVKKTLANPEPSTHGPRPTPRGRRGTSPLTEVHQPRARQVADAREVARIARHATGLKHLSLRFVASAGESPPWMKPLNALPKSAGQRNPTIVTLWHIAKALGVKLRYFFDEERPQRRTRLAPGDG